MKKIIFFLILIGLGVGGYYYWENSIKKKDEEINNKPKTSLVEFGRIFSIVDTTGKVVSNRDVEIKCKSSGQVIKLPYEVSSVVQENDLLVELDPVDEQRLMQQAEVTLAASRAKLAQAEQNLRIAQTRLEAERKKADVNLKAAIARANETQLKMKRAKELSQSKLASQNDYESAEISAIEAASALERAKIAMEELRLEEMSLEVKKQDIKLAQTQVELNEIDLSKSAQRLRDTKVFAPINGVISEQKIQIGQIISSGISNVGGGTAIMILSDLSHIFVVASVDESDIGRINLGQMAVVTTDAYPDRKFPGKVVLISTKGQTTSNVVTFEVKIEVLGDKHLLKPEMTAVVKIVTVEQQNVLIVPSECVYQKTDEDIQKDNPTQLLAQNNQEDTKPQHRQNQRAKPKAKENGNPAEVEQNEKEPNPETWMNEERLQKIYPSKQRKYFVQVLYPDGKAEEREVKVGIDDGTRTEITQGLKEGESVILDKGYIQSRWQNDANMNRGGRRPGGMRGGIH